MDITNNPLNFRDAIDEQSLKQAMHQRLPAGFAGYSVGVGAGSSNMHSPSYSSLYGQQSSVLSGPPPVYTPVANTPGLGSASGSEFPATLDNCLCSLDAAYKTNFTELADQLSYYCTELAGLRCPFWSIFHEFLDKKSLETSSSQKLQELGNKILEFYRDEYRVLTNHTNENFYPRLSQLTLVLCMHFLEQKFILEHQESTQQGSVDIVMSEDDRTGCQDLQPALVRKTFFKKLKSGVKNSGRAYAEKKIIKFIGENKSGLSDDMRRKHPVNDRLQFSNLRYEDIPGTTVSESYHTQLETYGNRYGIELEGLIEALGQTRCYSRTTQDPLAQTMKVVYNKTYIPRLKPDNFFNKPFEPYRDRNARTLLELINHFEKDSEENGNTLSREDMVESLNTLLTKSCGGNRIVKDRLIAFFKRL